MLSPGHRQGRGAMNSSRWQSFRMESRQPVASWQASQDEGWLTYNTLIVSEAPRKMGLEATASNKMRTGIAPDHL